MNLSAVLVVVVPPGVVMVMSRVPGGWAGEVAVIDVVELTVMLVAGPVPKATVVAPGTNPVPVMVTTVPPASGPPLGLVAMTIGTGS